MGAKVLLMPTCEDRAAVHTAVNVFLGTQRAQTRLLMLEAARSILNKYRISRLYISNYIVSRKNESIDITARNILHGDQRTCPGCGADIYDWPGDVRIVSIWEGRKQDLVTYGCRCGSVFAKLENV